MDCCNTPGNFINTDSWDEIDYITELELNSKLWLDHSFLQIGAWTNVETGDDQCSKDWYTLKRVNNSQADTSNYYIWGVEKQDIVWESVTGDVTNTLPVTIYHNSVDVTNDFSINYVKGIFITPTKYTGVLEASYSFRNVTTYVHQAAPWWSELLANRYDLDSDVIWGVFKKHSVSLPCIIIKGKSKVGFKPIQIGSRGQYVDRDISFTIFAANSITANKILNILSSQKDNNITLLDSSLAEFPLDCNGEIINNNTYSDLVTDNPWRCAEIVKVYNSEVESPITNLFINQVTMTFRVRNPVKNR